MASDVHELRKMADAPSRRSRRAGASDRDLRRAALAVVAMPDSRIARRHLARALGRAA